MDHLEDIAGKELRAQPLDAEEKKLLKDVVAYDESEFSRRRPVVVRAGRTLMVKAPEDTILRKMLWFREGGEVSDRQWRESSRR